jgi:hypothetical protein
MLIFTMYLFAILGVALILSAVIIKFRFPSTAHSKLLIAINSFNIKFTKTYITPNQSHIIAINETYKKIAIGINYPKKNKKATAKLYTFKDILGSEVIVNGLTLSKVSKRLQNSKMTATSADINMVNDPDDTNVIGDLTLKIYFNRKGTAVYSISFLPGLLPMQQSNVQYTQAYSQVQQLHGIIRSILSE